MNNIYLMVAADVEDMEGRPVLASEVVKYRLHRKVWPLYKNTPNRKAMSTGDKLAFYIAGQGAGSRHIIATGSVIGIDHSVRSGAYEHSEWLTETPTSVIHIGSVRWLTPPLDFKANLILLGYNIEGRRWGHILQGGVKRMSPRAADYIAAYPHTSELPQSR